MNDIMCLFPLLKESEHDHILNILFNSIDDFLRFFRTDGNDTQENRDVILQTDRLRFWYCQHINDTREIWGEIKNSDWAMWYCQHIVVRPELEKLINDEHMPKYKAWQDLQKARQDLWKARQLRRAEYG